MDASMLIPASAPIPVPWGWFNVLLIVTFVAHILMMNALLGGGVIAMARLFTGGGKGLPKNLSEKLPTMLALTINFGVAPLLFMQVLYGNLHYASSTLMAPYWLSIVGLVIIAYYGLYVFDFKFSMLGSPGVLLLISLSLLVWVGFMLANNMTLMLTPETWSGYFTKSGGTMLNLGDPALYPRYSHFLTASLAVGGLFVAILGQRSNNQGWIETGMKWFTRATMAQALVGSWFLLALPSGVVKKLMGGSPIATLLLCMGVLLAGIALWAGFKKRVWLATGLTVAAVLVMATLRDMVRTFYLDPYFKVQDLTVTNEYSPLVMFLAAFAVGLGCIWYMVRTYIRAGREA